MLSSQTVDLINLVILVLSKLVTPSFTVDQKLRSRGEKELRGKVEKKDRTDEGREKEKEGG